jgi:hypothetical protein
MPPHAPKKRAVTQCISKSSHNMTLGFANVLPMDVEGESFQPIHAAWIPASSDYKSSIVLGDRPPYLTGLIACGWQVRNEGRIYLTSFQQRPSHGFQLQKSSFTVHRTSGWSDQLVCLLYTSLLNQFCNSVLLDDHILV